MLNDNLSLLRSLKGLSQEDAAEAIGISRQAYAKWERGETIPDVEKCDALAKFYGITIDELLHNKPHQHGVVIPPAPKGKHLCGTTTVNERGQVVIPKSAREILKIQNGDNFIVLVDEVEGLALVKASFFENNLKTILENAHRKET